MIWRKKHCAGRRKREHIVALKQKQLIITAIEIGHFITDKAKHHLLE